MGKKAGLSGEAGTEKSLVARPGAVSRVNAEHYRWDMNAMRGTWLKTRS